MTRSSAFAELEALLVRDPGGRGAAFLVQPGSLECAARALVGAQHAVLLTGFPVLRAGAAETDGPGATLAVGEALRALGSEVTYLTDPLCAPLLHAIGARPLEVLTLEVGDRGAASAFLARVKPSHLLAIERPGRGADGQYRNMQGESIDALTSALDELFLAADDGITTVAIGDGGNELGLGKLRERVIEHVAHGALIATVVSADHSVAAGVSDWGGLVLVAALSVLTGRSLLPDAERVRERLAQLVAAGAVDGVTARAELTIDSRPLEETLALLAELEGILAQLSAE